MWHLGLGTSPGQCVEKRSAGTSVTLCAGLWTFSLQLGGERKRRASASSGNSGRFRAMSLVIPK